jgi:hypothetical protein
VGVYEKKLDKALNNIYSFFTTCDNFQTSMIEMTDAIATHLSLNGVNCNVDLNGSITKMIDPPPKLVLPKSEPSNSS